MVVRVRRNNCPVLADSGGRGAATIAVMQRNRIPTTTCLGSKPANATNKDRRL
jgi:hypothetical protein